MKNLIIVITCALILLTACSSAPSWKGLTESEIAAWKDAGFTPESAKDWRKLGLKAREARAWVKGGFDEDEAEDWIKEKFSEREASAWKKGGFSLKEAVRDRAKGLQPIR
jgi:hypothetical protein